MLAKVLLLAALGSVALTAPVMKAQLEERGTDAIFADNVDVHTESKRVPVGPDAIFATDVPVHDNRVRGASPHKIFANDVEVHGDEE